MKSTVDVSNGKYRMRDLLTLLENIEKFGSVVEDATLSASQITKYPERFDAFINHIQSRRPFYTKAGDEVVLDPSEAERFLTLKAAGQFSGGLKGRDLSGKDWPLSGFLKTAEFGGASAKPGEEGDITKVSKEAAKLKPSMVGLADRNIPAGKLGDEIVNSPILQSTVYGQAVIEMAQQLMNGQPAVIPENLRKIEPIRKAIVDYAGEYLGVLALVNGLSQWYGGASTKKNFLKWLGTDLGNLMLNFPSEPNSQIADSFATITNTATGHTLNISSKGTGGGAAPSLSGIKVPDHLRKNKQYQTAIDIIDLCSDTSIPSPYSVSQVFLMMNLLNERLPKTIPAEYQKFLPWPKEIVAQISDSLKNGTRMPKYEKLFKDLDSKGSDGGKLTYVVKKEVMKIVNGGQVPEFESVVLEVLDYNFIQQYASVATKTGVMTFATQWPAKLDGEVSMETKSGGTDPRKGGFSFKLHPVGTPVKVDPGPIPGSEEDIKASQPDNQPAKSSADDLDVVSQKRSGIKAATQKVEPSDDSAFGRKKRR